MTPVMGVPLMRTEAEQMEINQKRIEAEIYQLRVQANVQAQQTNFANFMGSKLAQDEKQQPHVTYNIFNGQSPPPPPPAANPAIRVNPNLEIQALQQKLVDERELSNVKLHEATSAAKLTVNENARNGSRNEET